MYTELIFDLTYSVYGVLLVFGLMLVPDGFECDEEDGTEAESEGQEE